MRRRRISVPPASARRRGSHRRQPKGRLQIGLAVRSAVRGIIGPASLSRRTGSSCWPK